MQFLVVPADGDLSISPAFHQLLVIAVAHALFTSRCWQHSHSQHCTQQTPETATAVTHKATDSVHVFEGRENSDIGALAVMCLLAQSVSACDSESTLLRSISTFDNDDGFFLACENFFFFWGGIIHFPPALFFFKWGSAHAH